MKPAREWDILGAPRGRSKPYTTCAPGCIYFHTIQSSYPAVDIRGNHTRAALPAVEMFEKGGQRAGTTSLPIATPR